MLATATLLRQHFMKHDAAQMANDLIVKETLGTPKRLVCDSRGLFGGESYSMCQDARRCFAGQGTYGRVRLAELTDAAKATLKASETVLEHPIKGVFALKVKVTLGKKAAPGGVTSGTRGSFERDD